MGCQRVKGKNLSPHLLGETKDKGIKNNIAGLAGEMAQWVNGFVKHLLYMTMVR